MKIFWNSGSHKMRLIYSSTDTDTPSPDDFIGQDVWVKCKNRRGTDYYVRFLAKTERPEAFDYQCNAIRASNREELNSCKYFSSAVNTDIFTEYKNSASGPPLTIDTPLEVIPTSELKFYASTDRDTIRKFIGKDLWVLFRWHTPSNQIKGPKGLVRFLSSNGDLVRYVSIDSTLTDLILDREYLSFDERYDLESAISDKNSGYDKHIDAFEIVKPVDVLTTEEIQDIVSSAGEYVEEYLEDDEEDEE